MLILSMHSEAAYVRNCLEAGARGYLLKNAMDLELVEAVKNVAAGEHGARSAPGDDRAAQRASARTRCRLANWRCCN